MAGASGMWENLALGKRSGVVAMAIRLQFVDDCLLYGMLVRLPK